MLEKNAEKFLIFHAQKGRIQLEAILRFQGEDLLIQLQGGKAHIGCAVLASPGKSALISQLPGHKDAEVAKSMAEACAKALNRNVAVCAGIHYDAMTREEIAGSLDLCADLTLQIISALKKGETMLTISHFEEFIEYIKSGELEKIFTESGDFQRGEILELLEKAIEAGELADEAATRLIYRGLHLPVEKTD